MPVVVLTTSQAEQDILRSYQLHTNAYIVKPIDIDQFSEAIGQIDDFFLTLAAQPQQVPASRELRGRQPG